MPVPNDDDDDDDDDGPSSADAKRASPTTPSSFRSPDTTCSRTALPVGEALVQGLGTMAAAMVEMAKVRSQSRSSPASSSAIEKLLERLIDGNESDRQRQAEVNLAILQQLAKLNEK